MAHWQDAPRRIKLCESPQAVPRAAIELLSKRLEMAEARLAALARPELNLLCLLLSMIRKRRSGLHSPSAGPSF